MDTDHFTYRFWDPANEHVRDEIDTHGCVVQEIRDGAAFDLAVPHGDDLSGSAGKTVLFEMHHSTGAEEFAYVFACEGDSVRTRWVEALRSSSSMQVQGDHLSQFTLGLPTPQKCKESDAPGRTSKTLQRTASSEFLWNTPKLSVSTDQPAAAAHDQGVAHGKSSSSNHRIATGGSSSTESRATSREAGASTMHQPWMDDGQLKGMGPSRLTFAAYMDGCHEIDGLEHVRARTRERLISLRDRCENLGWGDDEAWARCMPRLVPPGYIGAASAGVIAAPPHHLAHLLCTCLAAQLSLPAR